MTEILTGLMYSHNCGELRKGDVGKEVTLCGWVNKYRNLGGLHFIDIRDKHGLTQLNFEDYQGDIHILKQASLESVIKASGVVRLRPDSAINKDMGTGEVEILIKKFEVLSASDKDAIPFLPFGASGATEDLRLKYRYLELRTEKLQYILRKRSESAMAVRTFLNSHDFIEVETPILYKSTPEGARDYVVPSRVHPGKVYALPQSPQTLKQLLMIGGTGKYFQIAKCFRDEDLRADRQPEFTQVDIEIAFTSATYIKNLIEHIMPLFYGISKTRIDIPTMSYQLAMDLYGSDKPDIRYGLKHIIVNDLFKGSPFEVFSSVVNDGLIKAIFLSSTEGANDLARKDIDGLVEVVKPHGGKGVAWFKVGADGSRSGGVSKFITDDIYGELKKRAHNLCGGDAAGIKDDGVWLFVADKDRNVVDAAADALRRFLAKKLNLIKSGFHFLWVNDFPLLEWDRGENRFYAKHHPFTSPKLEDMELFLSGVPEKLAKCRAEAYDIVCNGYEIGGGSIRIHRQDVQAKMFQVLGMSEEDTRKQFGFFLEALKYGTPPHGGIALGLDRMVMLLVGTDNIRDVISFPKTASATDLMADAPSVPSKGQTDELHFQWKK